MALVVVLMGIVALCPMLACCSMAAPHPCCPSHHAPVSNQDCPSMALEKGKIAPLVSSSIQPPAVSATVTPEFTTVLLPAPAPLAHSGDLFLAVGVLRI